MPAITLPLLGRCNAETHPTIPAAALTISRPCNAIVFQSPAPMNQTSPMSGRTVGATNHVAIAAANPSSSDIDLVTPGSPRNKAERRPTRASFIHRRRGPPLSHTPMAGRREEAQAKRVFGNSSNGTARRGPLCLAQKCRWGVAICGLAAPTPMQTDGHCRHLRTRS